MTSSALLPSRKRPHTSQIFSTQFLTTVVHRVLSMALALSPSMAFPCHSGIQRSPQLSLVKPLFNSPSLNFPGTATTRTFHSRSRGSRSVSGGAAVVACSVRPLRPVEERFRIQVERNVDEAKLQALNVERWSRWASDVCAYEHEWKVDELVYIVKGCVRVTPEDCQDCTYFYAGDLVRFPKWFSATLSFDGEYEQRYRFLAYGDD